MVTMAEKRGMRRILEIGVSLGESEREELRARINPLPLVEALVMLHIIDKDGNCVESEQIDRDRDRLDFGSVCGKSALISQNGDFVKSAGSRGKK